MCNPKDHTMKTYLISYDLLKPGQNYADLHEAIKSLANGWWHCLESVWLINTTLSASAILDRLLVHIDADDKMVVILQGDDWATFNIPQDGNQWMRNHLRAA
jgi:hypothetical protein